MAYRVEIGNREFHGYRGNLHMHTTLSDGHFSHEQIAVAAERAGLDFVVITDHNVYEPGRAGWRGGTLVLVGEEVHDPNRERQSSHVLCFGIHEDVSRFGDDPQKLIDRVSESDGLTFLAHPFERDAGDFAREPNISWRDWDVTGYTGIEVWNYMSEYKASMSSKAWAVICAYMPALAITGPFPETLKKWDELLLERPVAAVGGSDAHGASYRLGPLSKVVQPYGHLFRCVNSHILTETPLTGDLQHDRTAVFSSLGSGRSFLGYEKAGDVTGFSFLARSEGAEATMGESLPLRGDVEIRVSTPAVARLRLLRYGVPVAQTTGDRLTMVTAEPGMYRAEAYRRYWGRERGWVFSNPIYIHEPEPAD